MKKIIFALFSIIMFFNPISAQVEKLIGPIPEGFFAREREASNTELESFHPD